MNYQKREKKKKEKKGNPQFLEALEMEERCSTHVAFRRKILLDNFVLERYDEAITIQVCEAKGPIGK